MTITFDYRFQQGWRFPICTLDLLGPGASGRVAIRALVDTGATYSIFLRSDAERVGIKLPALPNHTVTFGGGPGLGRRVRSTLDLGGIRFSTYVVYINDEDWPFRYSLLGRFGVFPHFSGVSFKERLPVPVVEFQF